MGRSVRNNSGASSFQGRRNLPLQSRPALRLVSSRGRDTVLSNHSDSSSTLEHICEPREQCVTKAGLLVAGCCPQQFYPKVHVDVAVHLGSEKASDSSVCFLDRVICEGTIGEMLEGFIEAVSKKLRHISTIQGIGREDELKIPVEVFARSDSECSYS